MTMRRRHFIAFLGGAAAAWPFATRGQQTVMLVIGFLHYGSAKAYAHIVSAVRQGLHESGFVEGQNVAIEYRWAEGQYDRLPALAGELVQRQVLAIVAAGVVAAEAAKAATTTIPIVFISGADPIAVGIVTSLNRPGGNATGVSIIAQELAAKRLELLRELVPHSRLMAMLINPDNLAAILNLVTWRRQRVHWDCESEKLQQQVNLNSTRHL